jgi:hypothetical protein
MSDFLAGMTVDAELDATARPAPPSKRRAARPVTEATIKDNGVALLNTLGYFIVKHMTGSGTRGTPDVMGCIEGRMVVVEFKNEVNVPTPVQLAQLRRWQSAGALAGWVRSNQHIRQLLDHLGDPAWRNDFREPGDGRGAGDSW